MQNLWQKVVPDEKSKVALLSITSNTVLVILKVFAGIWTGSVSILSEAIHSSLDLVAALIAYIAVRISRKPPDEEHEYGHGKVENVSGTIEAILIFVAAIWIIIEAYDKLVHGSEVETVLVGIFVMAFAAVANYLISSLLMKTARKTDSIALEADAMHLRTDVYTSVGVLVGLGLIQLTGWTILDPIIAIFVAALIIKAACDLTVEAFRPLLDSSLSDEEETQIKNALDRVNADAVLGYHQLRTRRSGAERYIDLHLVVARDFTVEQSHELAHRMEDEIQQNLRNANVLIHVEPCTDEDCNQCLSECVRPKSPTI